MHRADGTDNGSRGEMMKKIVLGGFLAAFVLLAAGSSTAAPPASWGTLASSSRVMGLFGTITLSGVPAPADNESLLAVFAPGVDAPVGLYRMGDLSPTAGEFSISVFGNDNDIVAGPKSGADDNDVLTFAFYDAAGDRVYRNLAIKDFGDFLGAGYPLATPRTEVRFVLSVSAPPGVPAAIDNVALAFTNPVSVEHDNWLQRGFGCSAVPPGASGPLTASSAVGIFILLIPAFVCLRRRKR
ncbi:MAG: hypothetical protein ACYC47_00415 [Desulfobacteria bacterium]|nr:hypothetical protein [Deltaproteobacteria bacterium]HQT96833.1 hypothetical protein [Thermodesulfobacteriota bacterium]